MGNALSLSGTLTSAPAPVSDSAFPSGSTMIPFALNSSSKPCPAETGAMQVSVSSPSAFVALPGLGAPPGVTQATTLYLRTNGPMTVRTTHASSGGDVTATHVVRGLFILEANETNYLKLVEVQGTGQVEYYVAGPQ